MPAAERAVIGANVIDLVRLLHKLERTRGQPFALSSPARRLAERRLSFTEWVKIELFHELIEAVESVLIKGNEQRAMEIGAAGGAAMQGAQKAYAVVGDPISSMLAMRHAWRAYYNFARISCTQTSASTVRYTLEEYPDMPMALGLMTVGWGVAAGRSAGIASTSYEVIERPWRGAPALVYDLRL